MIKKILLGFLGLILVTIASFLAWQYWHYSNDQRTNRNFVLPNVKLTAVVVNSITDEKTELIVRGTLKNNIPVTLAADSIEYDIFIDNVQVAKEHSKKSISISGNDSSDVSLPVTILTRQLLSVLNTREQRGIDSVEYRFVVSFFTNILFRNHFTVDSKKFLPLFHPLKIKAEHLRVSTMKFSGAVLDLNVTAENRNLFPIKAKNIDFELFIEDHKAIKGIIPGVTEFKPRNINQLNVPLNVTFKELGGTLFDVIRKGDEVKYRLHLSFTSAADSKVLKNCRIIVNSKGTVRSLLKVFKKK